VINGAASALEEAKKKFAPASKDVPDVGEGRRILNALKTVSPLIAAVLAHKTIDFVDDLENLLIASHKLIRNVITKLQMNGVTETTSNEVSAINALCISALAMDWTKNRDISGDWSSALVNAVMVCGISAEQEMSLATSQSALLLSANIRAAAYIYTEIHDTVGVDNIDTLFALSIRTLDERVKDAIKRLASFHITEEDTNEAYRLLVDAAAKVFLAVWKRERRIYEMEQRNRSYSGEEQPTFNISVVLRYFELAMKALVSGIYSTSRVNK